MVSSLVRLFSIQACAWAMQDDGRRPSRRSGRSTVEKFLEAKTDQSYWFLTKMSGLRRRQAQKEATYLSIPSYILRSRQSTLPSPDQPPGNASREGAHKMLTGTDAISGPGEPGRGRIVSRFRRQNVCQCLVLEPDLEVAVCHNGRCAAFLW